MKPVLGWTMLSQEEMRQVERSLANNEQDTRDEIGFLLIHQAFADRFFPGTSVLHTRVRYALFVPWIFQQAASMRRAGTDLDAIIRHLLIKLAIRLKQLGGEPTGVIGGDKIGQLTSQPPDRVYWTALRTWGLLLPGVDSRSVALRRLRIGARASVLDDEGGRLDEEVSDVFVGMPPWPEGWEEPESPLHFAIPIKERDFLRQRLRLLTRPDDTARALLARLVERCVFFQDQSAELPEELDACADDTDKRALRVARDAAALAAIGRAVYGALVERLIAQDDGPDEGAFCAQLGAYFESYGDAASRCDLDTVEVLIPELPTHVRNVLRETRLYVRNAKPETFFKLRDVYRKSEVIRKTARRARLLDTERSAQRRAEWRPDRHNTSPLHYRWFIVRDILRDLNGP